MTETPDNLPAADPDPHGQVAWLDISIGKAQLKGRVRATPTGLLAIGALVSGVLLSTAALVWVSTSVVRRHPIVGRAPRH
jgi:hypothetical protein